MSEIKQELEDFQAVIDRDPDPELLPEMGIAQVWEAILAAIPDVEHWNLNVPRLVHENGQGFKKFAQLEAAKRGYLWSAQAKGYILPWSMHAVNGKNLIGVGYRAGRLAVIFASKDGPHRYESVADNVPREVAETLWKSPYPDKRYAQVVKDKIEMQRVVV